MMTKTAGQRQRHGRSDHDADAPAQADEAHQHHHGKRDEELDHELVDRLADVDGLIGDLGQGSCPAASRR